MRAISDTRAGRRLLVAAASALAIVGSLSACTRTGAERPAAAPTVRIGRESVTTVSREEIRTGPMLSGELRPAREATVRAEVGGSVLDVSVEVGQSVTGGTVLARIEAHALEDAYTSAQSAVRSAGQALDLARREAERTAALVKGGALAERDLEMARNAVSAAEAQEADARARLASASKQLGDTVIRAPITGIVSARPVNAGDVVTSGSALVTIIDPSSMRLEASVPSEALAALRVGAPVEFQVRGYPGQVFSGRIDRISPVADPTTRQVPIIVGIPNAGGRLIAGLFAEGRVTSERRDALVVPASAVDTSGQRPWVLRLERGTVARVDVELGLRDERTGLVEITAGVSAGDQVLLGAAHAITPGTPVQVTGEPATAGGQAAAGSRTD